MTLSAIGLTNSHIIVGNSSNVGADVAMSGDVTIDNAGVTSIKSGVALAGSPTTTTQTSTDNSTKIATTAFVQSVVGAMAGPDFSSSIQTTPGLSAKLSVAHGLSAIPRLIQVWLVCNSAENGYSVGDAINISSNNANPANNAGYTISADATNINVSTGSGGTTPFGAFPKGGGAFVYLTIAKWGVQVYAWK